ncbi:hypothetical protein CHH26_10995 [Qipengyuania flava]|nr:hypothetical protein CHH26_10995 [Qipengyuania flava]
MLPQKAFGLSRDCMTMNGGLRLSSSFSTMLGKGLRTPDFKASDAPRMIVFTSARVGAMIDQSRLHA